MNHIITQMEK